MGCAMLTSVDVCRSVKRPESNPTRWFQAALRCVGDGAWRAISGRTPIGSTSLRSHPPSWPLPPATARGRSVPRRCFGLAGSCIVPPAQITLGLVQSMADGAEFLAVCIFGPVAPGLAVGLARLADVDFLVSGVLMGYDLCHRFAPGFVCHCVPHVYY